MSSLGTAELSKEFDDTTIHLYPMVDDIEAAPVDRISVSNIEIQTHTGNVESER